MDANFDELKKRLINKDNLLDSVDIEKRIREFKTELYIKRDEVVKLRKDLESTTSEINELKKNLSTLTRTNDENAFNYNILSKKYGSLMNEFMEKRDSYMKIQMQHKMTMAENGVLKERLEETETEKFELARKVEQFQAKQRHDFIYHKEIMKQHSNSNSFMEEITEMVSKLKIDHAEAVELTTKSKLAEEATEKLLHLSRDYEKIKMEKDALEELYIKTNAKCETLEELMSTRSDIHEPNLVSKIIFQNWKSSSAEYQSEMIGNNKILCQLTESYDSEETMNSQLVCRNEELKESLENMREAHAKIAKDFNCEIEKLKGRIHQLEGIEENEDYRVKNEPIEVED